MKSTARFSVDPRLSALLGESYTPVVRSPCVESAVLSPGII